MKGGTTSLYRQLCTHPDVFMPAVKEPDFFSLDATWNKGIDWYADLFSNAGQALAVGEASTSYSKRHEFPRAPERIAAVLPSARLIYVVRHPLHRAVSMYRHNVLMGREQAPIDEALRHQPMYLDASKYARQVNEYLKHFSKSQLLVITSEDLKSHPKRTLGAVTRHLGLTAEHVFDGNAAHNVTAERRLQTPLSMALSRSAWSRNLAAAMPKGVRNMLKPLVTRKPPSVLTDAEPNQDTTEFLKAQLKPEVDELQRLLNQDFQSWNLD
jgi:hypothetical protein